MASISQLFTKSADALRVTPAGPGGRRSRWSHVRRLGLKLALFTAIMVILMVGVGHAGDPTGSNTGTAADLAAKVAGKPTTAELATELGHLKASTNLFFLIFGFSLVFFMQTGFAILETGLTRAKNAAHVIMTNFVIFLIGVVAYWAVGFALQFGGFGALSTFGGTQVLGHSVSIGGWGLFGTQGFFLGGGNYDVAIIGFFLFQLVFMDTAATIPTGAMAERWKFSAFCAYGFFMAAVTYPIYGSWVWGGGWLAGLGKNLGLGHGALDFAGSGVVHALGGFAALAGAAVIGPRIGKFNKDGSPNAIPAHHIPMVVLGTIFLVFGWIGFNGASTLAATDMRFTVIIVNTFIASAFGGLAGMFLVWRKWGHPDPSMTANGALAGLVAITAPCAFVNTWAAAVIGLVAGILVVYAVTFVERVLKVDDPVGAVSVHGICGLWGLLSLGIFADGTYGAGFNGVPGGVTGLLYGGGGQFVAQLIDVVVVFIWGFGLMYVFFKTQDRLMGIRVSAEVELEGLDSTEMGISAYPDFRVGGNIGQGVFLHSPEGPGGSPLVPPTPRGATAQ